MPRFITFLICMAFAIVITLTANYVQLGQYITPYFADTFDTVVPKLDNEAALSGLALLVLLLVPVVGLAILLAIAWLLFRKRLSYHAVLLATLVGSWGTTVSMSLLRQPFL